MINILVSFFLIFRELFEISKIVLEEFDKDLELKQ